MTQRARVLFPGLALLTLLASAGTAMAATPPSVCYEARRTSTPSSYLSPSISGYCYNLRDSTQKFQEGKLDEALAGYERASQAAAAMTDPAQRAQSMDEARGARAIVLEAMGNSTGALALVQAPAEARPDNLLFLRGFMLARQNQPEEARKTLEQARTRWSPLWCPEYQDVLSGLDGDTAAIDGDARTLGFHYIPAYLREVTAKGSCASKGPDTSGAPVGRSYLVHFDSGKADWSRRQDAARNDTMLKQMAAVIRSYPSLKWLIVGHTDQECPRQHPGRDACFAANQDLSERRAQTVARRLEDMLGTVRPGARGMGMAVPVKDAGFGKPEAANRRVELILAGEAAAPSSHGCPWTVRVYDPALPAQASGETPSLALSAGMPPVSVSRDAVYEILYTPSAGPSPWKHYSATSELSDTGKLDLIQIGKGGDDALATLRAKGLRLPVDRARYIKVNPTGTTETVVLSVANRRPPINEILDAMPAASPGLAGLPPPRIYVVNAKGEEMLLRNLGPSKGPGLHDGGALLLKHRSAGPGQGGAGAPEVRVTPPAVEALTMETCRFSLGLL